MPKLLKNVLLFFDFYVSFVNLYAKILYAHKPRKPVTPTFSTTFKFLFYYFVSSFYQYSKKY